MRTASVLVVFALPTAVLADGAKVLSHPPLRSAVTIADRPAAAGQVLYVDAKTGRDDGDGGKAHPWRTIAHALKQLQAGQTLYLRAGT